MKGVTALVSISVALVVSAVPARAQQAGEGAELYARNCVSCHGATGVPNPAMARSLGNIPDFTDGRAMAALADSTLVNAVTAGKGRTMPAYRTRLTAEQIRAVVAYLRTFSRRPPQ